MKIFPGFYQLASNLRNVREPEKEILYDAQVSSDGELIIYMLPNGNYELHPNDQTKLNKFYSIFCSQVGSYEFILDKIREYYDEQTEE